MSLTVRRAVSAFVTVAAGLSLSLPPGVASGAAPSGGTGGPVSAGLAGSLTTPDGTWALVPMQGFWELFLRPTGRSAWSLRTPPGVADNGGLVLSGGSPGTLVVGFRPSQNLKYSPLAITVDSAGAWTPGIFPSALARLPDALGAAQGGRLVALSQTSGGSVWAGQGSGPSWARLTTLAALARSPALHACDPGVLTAVALTAAGTPLVGAECRRHGTVGIVALGGKAPQLIGPPLPGTLKSETVTVLRLTTTPEGVVALLLAGGREGSELLAAWEQPNGTWSVSPALRTGGATLASTFIGPGMSLGVLLTGPGSGPVPEAVEGPNSGWLRVPPTPHAAAVVAAVSGGELDAFGTAGDELEVWRLPPGAGSWTQSQTLKVPIHAGSSS